MRLPFLASILVLVSSVVDAETIEMQVNGLVCGFCAQGIEKTLKKNPATADVVVSLKDHLVAVAMKEGQDIADEVLKKALTDSGYEVKEIKRTQTAIGDIRMRVEQKHGE